MSDSLRERLELYLQLVNEAAVLGESIGDGLLACLAAAAACGAAEQLGLTDAHVERMRQDMRKRYFAVSASACDPPTSARITAVPVSAENVQARRAPRRR